MSRSIAWNWFYSDHIVFYWDTSSYCNKEVIRCGDKHQLCTGCRQTSRLVDFKTLWGGFIVYFSSESQLKHLHTFSLSIDKSWTKTTMSDDKAKCVSCLLTVSNLKKSIESLKAELRDKKRTHPGVYIHSHNPGQTSACLDCLRVWLPQHGKPPSLLRPGSSRDDPGFNHPVVRL